MAVAPQGGPASAVVPAKPARGRRGAKESDPIAWLFLAPAILLLSIFLVFPTLYTLALSFNRGRGGSFTEWVGLRNYENLLTKDPNFIDLGSFPPSGAIWNNVLWIIVVPAASVAVGLAVAVLADKLKPKWENSAKSLIFPLPAPGSQEKRTPLPWDAAAPYKGLGFREVQAKESGAAFAVTEFPVGRA